MNELQVFDFEGQNLAVKEIDREAYFNAEQIAIGLGLTKIAKGKEYVCWERVNEYLELSKSGQQFKRNDFITELQFYKLTYKDSPKTGLSKLWKDGDYKDKNTVTIRDGITRENPNQTVINVQGTGSTTGHKLG